MRNERPLVQLAGAFAALLRLRQLGGRLADLGSLLDRRQLTRLRRAVLRERPRVGRLLLVEGVLQLLAIDLDQRLAGLDRIAEIREHAADDAFGLRGNRDLVFGGERADDFDGAVERLLPDRLGLHQLRGRLAPGILSGFRSRTARRQRNRQARQDEHTVPLNMMSDQILLGMRGRGKLCGLGTVPRRESCSAAR